MIEFLFDGASVLTNESQLKKYDIFSHAGITGDCVVDCSKYAVLPGFVDVHVHFRQPGFSYKETIASGSTAAAKSGYFAVCTMPNLNPVPDSLDNLNQQLDIIKKDAKINVLHFGSITKGQKGKELSDLEAISPYVCGFSDDGVGVNDRGLMREAMQRAYVLNKVISAHCEDCTQIKDSPAAEWKQIERDIKLADDTRVKYHVCHVSTKESISLIRDAKKSGVDITCETAPHYLTFSTDDVRDDGRFRMNPPIRSLSDRLAMLEAVCDGTVDMIATDHAPHSAEEKSRGLASLNGIVGLEVAFPVLYTELVKKGLIPLERLIDLMSYAPSKRFGIDVQGFTVFDLNSEYKINVNNFASMGKCTPYENKSVFGKCIANVVNGRVVYIDKDKVSLC